MNQRYFIIKSDSRLGGFFRDKRNKIMVFDRILADFASEYGILSSKYDPYTYVRQVKSFTFSPYVRPICADWVCVESDVTGLCYLPQDQSTEPRMYYNELKRCEVSLAELFAPLKLRPREMCTNWAMSYRYAVFALTVDDDYSRPEGLDEIGIDCYTQLSYPRNLIASNNISKQNRIYVRNF